MNTLPPLQTNADFNGPTYNRRHDHRRLAGQISRIFALMQDGQWRSLSDIARVTRDPQASISAQLRHLRKAKFGSFVVERRSCGERERGLYEYRLLPPSTDQGEAT